MHQTTIQKQNASAHDIQREMFVRQFIDFQNKPGTAQVGAPLKVQNEQSVLHMRRDFFVKVSSTFPRRILPERTPLRFENHFD